MTLGRPENGGLLAEGFELFGHADAGGVEPGNLAEVPIVQIQIQLGAESRLRGGAQGDGIKTGDLPESAYGFLGEFSVGGRADGSAEHR